MFCPKCGTQIPDGAAFCTNCGAEAQIPVPASKPMRDTSNQETMTFAPIPEPVQDVPPVQEYPQNYSAHPTNAYTPPYTPPQPTYVPEKKSGNGGRIAVIITICVLIVGLLAALVILVLPGLTGDVEDIDGGSSSRSNRRDPNNTATTGSQVVPLTDSNPYINDFISEDTYVLSASNSKYYSRAELAGMTRQQLYLAEREMFARYGGTFTDGDLVAFFNAKSWYTPDSPAENFNESRFTDIERVNLLLLRALLMERDGTASSNPYLKLNSDIEGFILRYTDSSRITKNDVKDLTEKELIIAYNEIYARKGYIFEDNDLQLYFSSKNWYTPSILPGSFNRDVDLNEIEQDNYACLQQCVEKVKGVRFSAGNKYKTCYNTYSEFICPSSDTTKLNPYDLRYMSSEELMIARNEIYARYGYVYSIAELREYFMNCSWYYPTVANGKLSLITLSATEEYNVKLLQAFELNEALENGNANPNTKMTYYAKHDFMTMYLPDHWRNNCICIKPTGLSGNLEFYEKYNQEKESGWLFTMELVPTSQGIPSYPSRYVEVIGRVTTPAGEEYYVLNIMPMSPNIAFLDEVYDLMKSQIATIYDSIEWKSGYTFTKA